MLARLRRWWLTPEGKRVDRSRMYVWVHGGLVFVGISIAVRPRVGLLAQLSDGTNRALSACIIIGSTFALVGSAMGTRHFVPEAAVDLRRPYLFALGGQLSVIVSLTFYAWFITVHSDLIGTMAGALSIAIAGACIHIGLVAVKEFFCAMRRVKNAKADP
jgi:hypothetical protein